MMEIIALSPEDIKLLKKQMIPAFIFPFIVIAMFAAIHMFVISEMGSDFVIYIYPIVGLVFFGIIGYVIWTFVADIKGGVKHRMAGEVTDKRQNISTSTSSNSKSQTRTTITYFISIDGNEYSVNLNHYNQVKVGNQIVMEKAPKSDHTLKLEVVASGMEKESADALGQFLDQKYTELPFTQTDLDALKRMFQNSIKSKILWMSPFLFIIYGLWSADMLPLLIFMFPLVIIPAVQFYRICHTLLHYDRNKKYGQKVSIIALVLDKSTVTSNRTSTKQNIHTSWKNLQVTSDLYSKLAENEKILIFKPKFGKYPMSIVTLDKEEFYLV